jgi:hypothetical protein
MNPHRFVVLDQLSRNELGHFATRAEAEKCWLEFVRADPSVVGDLEIWDRDEHVRLDVDPDKISAVTAA